MNFSNTLQQKQY